MLRAGYSSHFAAKTKMTGSEPCDKTVGNLCLCRFLDSGYHSTYKHPLPRRQRISIPGQGTVS